MMQGTIAVANTNPIISGVSTICSPISIIVMKQVAIG